MNLGAVVVGIALSLFIAWAAFLVNSGRGKRRAEPAPQNLSPPITDEEMEGSWITRVLVIAVIAAGVLAVAMPIYYLTEPARQERAVDRFADRDVEQGERWFSHAGFQCEDCHGPAGVGGGADFVDATSNLSTLWSAPPLNDIFYRYDEDEVRYWITFGRPGTPMPAWGLDGGGAMTSQEIDQLLAYVRSIQIPQAEAVAQTDTLVAQALNRLDEAAETVTNAIVAQEARIAEIETSQSTYEQVQDVPVDVEAVLTGPGTCTDHTAELFDKPCDGAGGDADRDRVADAAEAVIAEMMGEVVAVAGSLMSDVQQARLGFHYDSGNAFTNDDPQTGEPLSDLDALDSAVTSLEAVILNLSITAENQDVFMQQAATGLVFLERASADAEFEIDFAALTSAIDDDGNRLFSGMEEARRAAGLFNAFCARCHTPGYAAGVPFTGRAGSGAWGPSLRDGRAAGQFPEIADHLEFAISGSDNAVNYGVSGIGRGWMPGFGFTLSRADLELIIKFERTL